MTEFAKQPSCIPGVPTELPENERSLQETFKLALRCPEAQAYEDHPTPNTSRRNLVNCVLIGPGHIPVPSRFKRSKQVLQHGPNFQLVHLIFAKNLPALKTIVAQLLDRGKNLDIFAATTAPFNKVDNVDVATANSLSQVLVHTNHEKELCGAYWST